MIKALSKLMCIVVLSPVFRIRVSGKENIPDDGPLILCPNHVTMLDMFFIGPRVKRWIYWMAKQELFEIPGFSFILSKWWEAFPVKRGRTDVGSVRNAIKHLDMGHIVGIFPQGTRGGKRVQPGAAVLAVKKGVPILPVGVKGGKRVFEKVHIVFGKPFTYKPLNCENEKKEIREFSKQIMERIFGLLEAID